MSYSDVVATIAMIVSITAVPASGYFSYRYAIMGEKRKEWNLLAEPILNYFFKAENDHINSDFSMVYEVPIESIKSLSRRFSAEEYVSITPLISGYMRVIHEVKNTKPLSIQQKGQLGLEAAKIAHEIQELIKIK